VKEKTHPTWHEAAVVQCACGNSWTTGATVPLIKTDICSRCHPFYTGEQRIVDTEGQVDRFMKRLQAREERIQAVEKARDEAVNLPMDIAITTLPDINARSLNALAAAGIATIGNFLERFDESGDEGMLAIAGFGRKSLIDVKKKLRQMGYELAGSDDE
jgi:large subunit ribosomal protein L31